MAAPNRGFSEKVVVVTDGANPFGRAVALSLALSGCYVVAGFAETSAATDRALTEMQSIGTLASAVNADVATESGVARLFETVAQTYGRLDMLVNTAVFESNLGFARTSAADFDRVINQNLKSAFFCAQAAVLLMKNRPNASIVNFAAKSANNRLSHATQAAIVGLTEALAEELAPFVRVNCVAWKSDEKPSEKSIEIASEKPDFELLRQPSVIAPDDAARTAIYLLSPEAAALSGQTIRLKSKPRKI